MNPADAASPSRNLPANGEIAKREDMFLSPRIVTREAVKIVAAMGIEVRPAALRRLVTGFIRHGYTSLDDLEPFMFRYRLDPTGEFVVRKVMRERGW
jgi:hypothetical protein